MIKGKEKKYMPPYYVTHGKWDYQRILPGKISFPGQVYLDKMALRILWSQVILALGISLGS